MRRAILAPLASGLILPGLGQLLNRQAGKGALLVMGMSLWFMATLFLVVYKFSGAVSALGDIPAGTNKWAALGQELSRQGFGWLWVLGLVFACFWLYAVIDAFRTGRRLDQAPKEDKG